LAAVNSSKGKLSYRSTIAESGRHRLSSGEVACLKGAGIGAGRETDVIKIFTVAAAVLALIATPASAQVQGKRHQGDQQKKEEKKPVIDEKAYKAALERIPEPKEKYDPWGVARPAEPAKKQK
jgi:hypothetical protein